MHAETSKQAERQSDRGPEQLKTGAIEGGSGREPELTGAPEWQRAGAVKC